VKANAKGQFIVFYIPGIQIFCSTQFQYEKTAPAGRKGFWPVRQQIKGGVSECIKTPPLISRGYRFLTGQQVLQASPQKPPPVFRRRSGQVEAVKVHYLVPGCHEIVQEFFLGIGTSVHFRQGAQLGVRTENEVDTGAGPFEIAGC